MTARTLANARLEANHLLSGQSKFDLLQDTQIATRSLRKWAWAC